MKLFSSSLIRAIVIAALLLAATSLLTACQMPDFVTKLMPSQEETEVAGESIEEIPVVTETPEIETPVQPEKEALTSEPSGPGSVEFDGTAGSLRGLILFTSTAGDPLVESSPIADAASPGERYLWAIAPDGSRVSRISPDDQGTAIVRPSASVDEVLYFPQGYNIAGEPFSAVQLPAACDGDPSCGSIQFTTDGRFVAFLHGPDDCGRSLTLWDIQARETLNTWKGVHWFYVMNDGGLVINMGGCERRYVYNFAPNTGRQGNLGLDGTSIWNAARSAVLWVVQDSLLIKKGLWGLNFETSKAFARISDESVIEDAPTWAPDSEHFLYNRRTFRYDQSSKAFVLEGPRQVILMNAWTRKQKQMAYAPGYNYHICDTASQPCSSWSGDWIQVLRTPFRKATIRAAELEMPTARCALYGQDCETPAEVFALNWQTGELLPWDEAGVPEPEPAHATAPANLESDPIYTDPGGEFALFTSRGSRSLWYVPTDGSEPRLLVADGEKFTYIP